MALPVLLLVMPRIRRCTVIPVTDRRRRNRITALGAERPGSLSNAALSSIILFEDHAAACNLPSLRPKIEDYLRVSLFIKIPGRHTQRQMSFIAAAGSSPNRNLDPPRATFFFLP